MSENPKFKDSFIGRTRQGWKVLVGFVATGVGLTGHVFSIYGDVGNDQFMMLSLGLAMAGLLFGIFGARCPNCGARPVWRAMNERSLHNWFIWLVELKRCHACGYPQVTVDPDATSSEFIAITSLDLDGEEIVGATLAFRTLDDLVEDGRLLTHMMGYAFGLGDSDDVNDRRHFDWWSRRSNDFSPKEALIMRLMLERPAGNRWPDNDRSLGASGLRRLGVQGFRAPRS